MNIPLTFFSLPRAFLKEFSYIQRNAVKSWRTIHPNSEIILFGDEKGTRQVVQEVNGKHHKMIQTNEFGTPYIHTIFGDVQKSATVNVLCYFNTDMILLNSLGKLIKLAEQTFKQFLLIACRWDLKLEREISFSKNWRKVLYNQLQKDGRPPSPKIGGGIDCFIFTKNLFPVKNFPAFLLGRELWDSWLVTNAIHRAIPVVDIGLEIIVIHQTHTRPEDSLDPQRIRTELKYNTQLYQAYYQKQLKVPDSTFILHNGEFRKR